MKARAKLIIIFVSIHLNPLLANLDQYTTDFDISLGKEDPYGKKFYAELMDQLPNTNSRWFRFIKGCGAASSVFSSLRENYHSNKLTVGNQIRIPKVFHQIWIGKKPFPAHYKKWQETWRSIPGWRYKLWT